MSERDRWKRLRDPEEVRRAVESELGAHPTPAEVERWASENGLEHSQLTDGVIYVSAPAPRSSLLVRGKWLLEFHFDASGELAELRVAQGLIGP